MLSTLLPSGCGPAVPAELCAEAACSADAVASAVLHCPSETLPEDEVLPSLAKPCREQAHLSLTAPAEVLSLCPHEQVMSCIWSEPQLRMCGVAFGSGALRASAEQGLIHSAQAQP